MAIAEKYMPIIGELRNLYPEYADLSESDLLSGAQKNVPDIVGRLASSSHKGIDPARIEHGVRQSLGMSSTYTAPEDRNALQAGAEGFGNTIAKVGTTIGKVFGDEERDAELDAAQEKRNRRTQELGAAGVHPLATTIGEIGGAITAGSVVPVGLVASGVSNLVKMAPGLTKALAPLAGTVAEGGVVGGVTNALLGEDVLTGAGMGSAGGVLGHALGRLAFGASQKVFGSKLAKEAADLGYKTSPGQRFDSEPLRKLEVGIESNPVTSGTLAANKEANRQLFSKQINEEMFPKRLSNERGMFKSMDDLEELAKNPNMDLPPNARQDFLDDSVTLLRNGHVDEVTLGATERLLKDSFESIGKTIDDAGAGVNLRSIAGQIENIAQEADVSWTKSDTFSSVVNRIRDDIANLGSIDGKTFMRRRSEVAKAMSDAYKANKEALGDNLSGLLNTLDDALGDTVRRIPEESRWVINQFGDIRKKWKLYEAVNKSHREGARHVSPLVLSGQRQMKEGRAMAEQFPNLYTPVKFTRQLGDILGDSETATRLAVPAIGALVGAGAGGYYGGWEGAAAGAAKGLLAPHLAAKGYAGRGFGHPFTTTKFADKWFPRASARIGLLGGGAGYGYAGSESAKK